ncbi:MAG: DUF3782 domain-containing protein [Desulfobacteraceae bacterium]|nr:DUF3782 domain-containing protein [Desulfobacteraceae bacterium]
MQTELNEEQIRNIIINELPVILEKDQEVRRFILEITKNKFADREKTEDRIDRILDELKHDREKNDIKWEAQEKKWEVQDKKWEKRWEAQEKKWEKRWEAQEKKWEKRWEAQEKKWEENQKIIKEMLASVKALDKKHDSTIGALGARWGLRSEEAFRDGLKSILEDSFGVKVERYQDFDHEGVVFGRPDQIEMDLIIHNGTLILCEIKSSVSKSEMYTFWRKKKFYEDRHQRTADRTIVISPMTDRAAADVAEKLGVEIFGYADEVTV